MGPDLGSAGGAGAALEVLSRLLQPAMPESALGSTGRLALLLLPHVHAAQHGSTWSALLQVGRPACGAVFSCVLRVCGPIPAWLVRWMLALFAFSFVVALFPWLVSCGMLAMLGAYVMLCPHSCE